MHNKVREPLFHIVKRDTLPWYQAWGRISPSCCAFRWP